MANKSLEEILSQLFEDVCAITPEQIDESEPELWEKIRRGFGYAISLVDDSSKDTKARLLRKYKKAHDLPGKHVKAKKSKKEIFEELSSFSEGLENGDFEDGAIFAYYDGAHYDISYSLDKGKLGHREGKSKYKHPKGLDKMCEALFELSEGKRIIYWWYAPESHGKRVRVSFFLEYRSDGAGCSFVEKHKEVKMWKVWNNPALEETSYKEAGAAANKLWELVRRYI